MTLKTQKTAASEKPAWFITGCSTGFGHELATQLLALKCRVAVTARDPAELAEFAGNANALALRLDVTDQRQVNQAVRAAEKKFGGIGVLVNNAGIGYFGAVEESEESEVRRLFDINFFGMGRMIRAALPGMRAHRRGIIVNISSLAGLRGSPSLGYYCASKHAVEGLSDALCQEVAPLGIKVMVVEPSGFRTDWAGRSANESKVQIADYAGTAGEWRKEIREQSGKQPGDPVRAAEAIIQAVHSGKPPRHLLLGNNAFKGAMKKLDELRKDYLAWEKVSRGADFPKKEKSVAA